MGAGFPWLHTWAAAAIQALLELSLRSFLGAGWGNSTVVQNSWPLGDETPLAWIIKAQKDCSEKSTLTSAWGRSHLLESTLRSLGSASQLAEYAQSSGFLMDEMQRCTDAVSPGLPLHLAISFQSNWSQQCWFGIIKSKEEIQWWLPFSEVTHMLSVANTWLPEAGSYGKMCIWP